MRLTIFLASGVILPLTLGASVAPGGPEGGMVEYFTAFLNISYFDKTRGVFHTEKTETGRFSTNFPKDFHGVVVPLMSNFTIIKGENGSTIPDIHYELTGKIDECLIIQ